MSLEVIDFYSTGKIGLNRSLGMLMSDSTFCILVNDNNKIRELEVTVPKKFVFRKSKSEYSIEYSVLIDFLKSSERMTKSKWHLSDNSYTELLLGLYNCMISKSTNFNGFIKSYLKFKGLIKLKLFRIRKGI